MEVKVKQGGVHAESADALVVAHYEGEASLQDETAVVDRTLHGWLQNLLKSKEFEGKSQQTALVHTHGAIQAKRVLLVGLGKKQEATLDTVRQAMGTAAKRIRQIGGQSFAAAVIGRGISEVTSRELAQAMVEGTMLGGYQFITYRSHTKEEGKNLVRMTLVSPRVNQVPDLKEGARRGLVSAEATAFVRDLGNHPANVMTPSRLAQEARKIAREQSVRVKVLDRREIARLGMGALLGVARGSHEPPMFIILEYRGRDASRRRAARTEKPIVLVGKTVTFDTGGISLKPSENMEQMKADMAGGAAVLATVRAAARLRLPLHLIGLLPATENMPGGRAMKPGDIITTLSGKTVEVQNTDAEGRLILADALTYATRYKPAAIIDIATLTGACMVALGQFAIGMFGNHEPLKRLMEQAGRKAGERVWEMPLWEEYFEQLHSEVADMRNIGGRGGGMITAALFLSKFAGEVPWVHLDIASTDWSERERPYIAKGSTGTGTRLLIQYLLDAAQHVK